MMFKLLFLKKLYDLSDEALISSAQTDMAYKFFLDLEPEAKMIDPSLLTKFRKTRITEDILEEIVGNIQDEYDDEEEEISKIDDTTFTVDGVTYIDELDEVFHVSLPEGDYDTVGGFIISRLGYLPQDGEMNVVEYKNLRFTVLNVEDRRIGKVKIEILPVEEEKEDAEDDSKREKGGWFAERREEKEKDKEKAE